MRVISLEDHFMDPDISAASGNPNPRAEGGSPQDRNLLDLREAALDLLDEALHRFRAS